MGGVEGLRDALADRYTIEREVGHGAMARVYRARDLRYNRHVALKVLNPELSAALGPERFLREIDVVAHLNHPHILPLLDSGDAGGALFYVMPYVEGESLRHRLNREIQLRIDDAVTLTREVALALDYAHQQGIVHRDVKPENILLSRGYAVLADFGIARVLSRVDDQDRITQTGVSPGTPAYMSPEQCGGEPVDGRADLYALGCVLYELLAGTPPFMGPSTQAVLARHLADPVPPLRTVRRTVSEGLERVVLRVLEKVPADRYATGAEFAAALAAPPVVTPRPWWERLTTGQAITAIAAVMLGVFVGVKVIPQIWNGSGVTELDSTRYAIFPFERDSGIALSNEDQQLQDAILRWTGVSVVDQPRMREELARRGPRLTTSDIAAIAGRVGAGRYVLSQVSRVGDSLRIHAAVYSTVVRGTPVHEGTVKFRQNASQTEGAFARIADYLLFDKPGPGSSLSGQYGTTSRPARQAFERGLDSVYEWNLTAADTALSVATASDPQNPAALLWLALVRFWSGAPMATWQSAAERAATRRGQLEPRDQLLSDVLIMLGRGDVERACRSWRRMTTLQPNDFATWYGSAYCQASDQVVVRDPVSPSGWGFRTSYDGALRGYQRAFELLPSILKSFRKGSYQPLRRLFMTSGAERRRGRALSPDTMTFDAAAEWQGDSLAFFPYPSNNTLHPITWPREEAVRRLRIRFRDVALAWVSSSPKSADAMEALAISLGMLGDPAALDTIRRARGLVRDADNRLRVAVTEVWVQLSFSIPTDLAGIQRARSLADSLLREQPPNHAGDPSQLACLAGLTGRADLVAGYFRDPPIADQFGVPFSLRENALSFLAYASLGGPRDSLIALEQRVRTAIKERLLPAQRAGASLIWLAWPATLAFPEHRLESVSTLSGKGDWLLDLQAASARGDTAAVRRGLDAVHKMRKGTFAANLTLDALYPEADLLAGIGDQQAAGDWLDPTLQSMPQVASNILASPFCAVRSASMVRAMALRATLAQQRGDRAAAARWAKAVVELWSDADAFLQPQIQRLRRLAG